MTEYQRYPLWMAPNPKISSQVKAASPPKQVSNAGDKLNEEIAAQGNKVRDLKSKKAEKSEIDAAVAILLDLKAKFKAETGQDWKPASGGGEAKKNESKKGTFREMS